MAFQGSDLHQYFCFSRHEPFATRVFDVQEGRYQGGMVYLIREVDYQRVQGTAVLASAKFLEGVRELDGMIKVSNCVLAVAMPCLHSSASNLLAQLVHQICKALGAVDVRNASIISGPPRHRQ